MENIFGVKKLNVERFLCIKFTSDVSHNVVLFECNDFPLRVIREYFLAGHGKLYCM